MSATTQNHRAAKLEAIAHYLTAFVVLLKGIDKIEHSKVLVGSLFVGFAVFIVLGTIFHHKLEKHLRHFKAYVFMIEAVVISIVGVFYMQDGKSYIQYVCFASAIIFVIATFIYFSKGKARTSTR